MKLPALSLFILMLSPVSSLAQTTTGEAAESVSLATAAIQTAAENADSSATSEPGAQVPPGVAGATPPGTESTATVHQDVQVTDTGTTTTLSPAGTRSVEEPEKSFPWGLLGLLGLLGLFRRSRPIAERGDRIT